MNYQILPVLEQPDVDRILRDLAGVNFIDGKATAEGHAREAKSNLQAERSGTALDEPDELVQSALYGNAIFQAFAFPKRMMLPLYSRYEPGMEYGPHVDGGIISTTGDTLRTDLAVTLFLNPPDSYDGGELVLQLPYGEDQIKLAAGEAVVYPASSVHRVAPVTRGVRLAAVTWVQSAVRDDRMRTLLFDLFLAMEQAEKGEPPVLLLSKTYHNLLRMTAEI